MRHTEARHGEQERKQHDQQRTVTQYDRVRIHARRRVILPRTANHLSLWQREEYMQWLEIPGGCDVKQTVQAHLRQADLILLLISPDFFTQDLCYMGVKTSLQEQSRRQVPVVPVLVLAHAPAR